MPIIVMPRPIKVVERESMVPVTIVGFVPGTKWSTGTRDRRSDVEMYYDEVLPPEIRERTRKRDLTGAKTKFLDNPFHDDPIWESPDIIVEPYDWLVPEDQQGSGIEDVIGDVGVRIRGRPFFEADNLWDALKVNAEWVLNTQEGREWWMANFDEIVEFGLWRAGQFGNTGKTPGGKRPDGLVDSTEYLDDLDPSTTFVENVEYWFRNLFE